MVSSPPTPRELPPFGPPLLLEFLPSVEGGGGAEWGCGYFLELHNSENVLFSHTKDCSMLIIFNDC